MIALSHFLSLLPRLAALAAVALLALGPVASAQSAPPAAQEPRELIVLAGAGQDTAAALAFFPQNVRVRVGDTVVWKLGGDEEHTVSFVAGTTPVGRAEPTGAGLPGQLIPFPIAPVPEGPPGLTMLNPEQIFPTRAPGASTEAYAGPGAFVNSGRLGREPLVPGTPLNDSFSLVFDAPGIFPYMCLIHAPRNMFGTVEVVAASAADVPSQAEIDAQAQEEVAALLSLIEGSRAQAGQSRNVSGPGGATLWTVLAGNRPNAINDVRVQLLEFLPRDLTVAVGDTVLWESDFFHTVTFVPTPPPPERFLPEILPDGSARVIRNPAVFNPARPGPVFDPAQVFNSAPIGSTGPNGATWALTFERPGTFEYFCAVHREAGMVGSITVLPRS